MALFYQWKWILDEENITPSTWHHNRCYRALIASTKIIFNQPRIDFLTSIELPQSHCLISVLQHAISIKVSRLEPLQLAIPNTRVENQNIENLSSSKWWKNSISRKRNYSFHQLHPVTRINKCILRVTTCLQFQEDIKSCKKFFPAKYLVTFHFSAD